MLVSDSDTGTRLSCPPPQDQYNLAASTKLSNDELRQVHSLTLSFMLQLSSLVTL